MEWFPSALQLTLARRTLRLMPRVAEKLPARSRASHHFRSARRGLTAALVAGPLLSMACGTRINWTERALAANCPTEEQRGYGTQPVLSPAECPPIDSADSQTIRRSEWRGRRAAEGWEYLVATMIDPYGQPVSSATVVAYQGTMCSSAAITNHCGRFALPVLKSSAPLRVFGYGYQSVLIIVPQGWRKVLQLRRFEYEIEEPLETASASPAESKTASRVQASS